ncbi:MAG: hypothetical protein SVV80_09460 [Planctomycetota bacterium]|nr:hypothetical protein [Planctomycetota bacterium]
MPLWCDMEKPASSNVPRPVGKAEKKRRRWRLLLMVVLLLATVIVWASPYLLSTGPGRNLIVSIINNRIKGTFRIGEISLSWLGPCQVKNLQAMDLDGREVLSIENISLNAGLLGLLKNAEHFDHASASSPRVMLYLNAEGLPSLAEALEPVKPSPRQVAPETRGSITVTDGTVAVIRPDEREYEIRGINATISLDMPALVEGKIDFAPAAGGRFSIAFNLSDLTEGGKFRLDGMRGDFRLATDEPAPLSRLVEFAGSRTEIDGAARVGLTGNIAQGQITSDFDLSVFALRSGGPKQSALRPIDLHLAGNFSAKAGKISGECRLTGEAGNLRAIFSYEPSDAPLHLSWEKLLTAAFGGESITLPGVSLDITKAQFDLPKLARAVPSLLKVLPDVEITSGTVVAEDVSIRGGSAPSVRGRVVFDKLQARKGQTEISCRPVSLSLNAVIERQTGIRIDTFEFTSVFCDAECKGTTTDLAMQFRMNLQRFHEEPGKIFDIGSAFPRGQIDGTVKLARSRDGRVDFLTSGLVEDLEYRADKRTLDLDSLRIAQKGHLLLQKRKLLEAVITTVQINLAKELSLELAGRYQHDKKTFQCNVNVKQADLLPLEKRFRNRIPAALPEISGSLTGKIAVSMPAGEKHLLSDGDVILKDLRIDGRLPTDEPVGLEWSGLKLTFDLSLIDVASAGLESEPMTLLAEKVRLALGKDFQADGDVAVSADIEECLAAAHLFVKWKKPPRISGDLIWRGQSRYADKGVRLSGKGMIKEMSVGSGQRTFSQEEVAFAHVTVLDHVGERITLEKTDVVSKALSLQMGGAIDRIGSEWVLNLSGSYEGSWEDLTAMLHELAPDTKAKISFTGKTGGKVTVTGPARKPEVRPAFRAVTAKTTLGWARADVLGVALNHAELSPVLKDGQVLIPETVIAAGDGKVRPFGTLDMQGEYSVLRLPGKVRVLENLKITPQMNEDLLARFNPIFAELADLEGEVSLDTDNLVLPLSSKIKHAGRGAGHLDLQKLKVRPKGILAELLKLSISDVKGQTPLQVRGVDFVIRDGRINYDNFTLVFPGGFDLKFYGSVGFDDTLDLAVSVPVSARVLEKFGVRGPVIDYARLLAGARIDIPVIGTRLNPRLDFSKVDIRPLINRAIQALLAEQAGKMLEDVLKDHRKKDKDPEDKDNNEDADPLLDSLLDLLKKPKPAKP